MEKDKEQDPDGKKRTCTWCGGTGKKAGGRGRCGRCNGTGKVRVQKEQLEEGKMPTIAQEKEIQEEVMPLAGLAAIIEFAHDAVVSDRAWSALVEETGLQANLEGTGCTAEESRRQLHQVIDVMRARLVMFSILQQARRGMAAEGDSPAMRGGIL